MTFAENIIVMDQGSIVQAGTPSELFDRPKTTFVGYFIGAPAMNLFACSAVNNTTISFGSAEIVTDTNLAAVASQNLNLGIRSEYIQLADAAAKNTLSAQVRRVEDLGSHKLVTADFEGQSVKIKVKREREVSAKTVFLTIPARHCCVN